jgi:hypothetical protein
LSIEGELVLPGDVRVGPVAQLAPDVRSQIDAGDDDYAVSRERSRTSSSVVDRDTAELLEHFRTPTRIVDAVLAFARARGLDPESTLEGAYPVLDHLYRRQLLVAADSRQARPIEGRLRAGDVVAGFRLIRCIQVASDNEVFLARDDSGRHAALKFHREAGPATIDALEREAGVLQRIPAGRAPCVFGLFRFDTGAGLATEWVAGDDAQAAADRLRGGHGPRSERDLLGLCAEVAAAFADVHEAGLLHGDIHPRNVLVEKGGTVRLIDFGSAREIAASGTAGERRGVPFYFDPELAQALRERRPAADTCAAEQYSVGALLYQLWTGVHYLDWNLGRDELLRQIVEDEPVTFDRRRIPAWPQLEATLRRALHKDPGQRFADLRALADALRALRPEAEARDGRTAARLGSSGRAPESELLATALERYGLGSAVLRDGPAEAPRASVNYGAAGIAYTLLRIAQRRGDPHVLALADLWSQKAYALAGSEGAFHNLKLEIGPKTVGERSLFHSASGLHCVRALVSAAQGDAGTANAALRSFIEDSRGPNVLLDRQLARDAVVGEGSLLLGCAELIEVMSGLPSFETAGVRVRGEEIERDLLNFLESAPIESSELTTLGIAHGWAGLAFVLLRWARANGRDPQPVVLGRLEELASLAEPEGAGLRWPVQRGGSAFWDGWCNGSAGYAMLYAHAHRIQGRSRFGEIAERAAISAWGSELSVGTLCCGQGGIGYALLAAHRVTGSPYWLQRARACARRAAADTSADFLADALYKGAVGVALLADELEAPESAAMPLFEPVY